MSTNSLALPHLGPFLLLPLLGQVRWGGGHLGRPCSSKRGEKPNRSFLITVTTVGTKQLYCYILHSSGSFGMDGDPWTVSGLSTVSGVSTGFKSGR